MACLLYAGLDTMELASLILLDWCVVTEIDV